jgi:hypothetical protein
MTRSSDAMEMLWVALELECVLVRAEDIYYLELRRRLGQRVKSECFSREADARFAASRWGAQLMRAMSDEFDN